MIILGVAFLPLPLTLVYQINLFVKWEEVYEEVKLDLQRKHSFFFFLFSFFCLGLLLQGRNLLFHLIFMEHFLDICIYIYIHI